jgi:hypothetical protein
MSTRSINKRTGKHSRANKQTNSLCMPSISPLSKTYSLPATPEHAPVYSPLPSDTLFKLENKLRTPVAIASPVRYRYSPGAAAVSPSTPPTRRSDDGSGGGEHEGTTNVRQRFKRNFGALLGVTSGQEQTGLPPAKRTSSFSSSSTILKETQTSDTASVLPGKIAANVSHSTSLPGLRGNSASSGISSPLQFKVKRSKETMAQSQVPKRSNKALQYRSISGLPTTRGTRGTKGHIGGKFFSLPKYLCACCGTSNPIHFLSLAESIVDIKSFHDHILNISSTNETRTV